MTFPPGTPPQTLEFLAYVEAAESGNEKALEAVRRVCVNAAKNAPADDLLKYIARSLLRMQLDYYTLAADNGEFILELKK